LRGEHRGANLALPQADYIHNGLRRTGNVREKGMEVVLESAGNLDHQYPRQDWVGQTKLSSPWRERKRCSSLQNQPLSSS